VIAGHIAQQKMEEGKKAIDIAAHSCCSHRCSLVLLAPLLCLFFCSRHLDHHQVGGRATHVQSFNELKRSIPHHLSTAHSFSFR